MSESPYDQVIELVDNLARPMSQDEYLDFINLLAAEFATRAEAAENEAA
jgi:hypothetical protein